MESHILQHLQSHVATIHVRWETLLRLEPVSGPLANPDALVRLIPESLAEIFDLISRKPDPNLTLDAVKSERMPSCNCGHNPYLAYFIAAERALVETVVHIQAEFPPGKRKESDMAHVIRCVRQLGRNEVDTFCGICTHRCVDPNCRHRLVTA